MHTEFAYTRHQTLRGAKPDADVGGKLYLIKNVSEMRLTYQIRVLAYLAHAQSKKLIVQLPKQATVHASLRDFVRSANGLVKIERA
jgi:hypothetical protein